MFRTVLIALAVVTASGQDAALLCRAWCDGAVPASARCHQTNSSPVLAATSSDECALPAATLLVLDEARRDQTARATVTTAASFTPGMAVGAHAVHDLGHLAPPLNRPLAIELRI